MKGLVNAIETPAETALLTALSLPGHENALLLGTSSHMQLTLVLVGVAVGATHRLVGSHTLSRTHTPASLRHTDSPELALATEF